MAEEKVYATGSRKRATAKVWLIPGGSGKIRVNGKDFDNVFGWREYYRKAVMLPFEVTGTVGKFDVEAWVEGGGITGQVEALRHGIARALLAYNPEFKPALKSYKLLTRDPREKERQKYGLKRARRAPQYSKR